jgi:hypothetical protein
MRRLDPYTRRLVRLFLAGAAALLPWTVLLAVALPMTTSVRRWSVAWIGLDAMQAMGLVVTGWLLLRRSPAASLVAGVTAGLLLVDGWFDMTTAAIGWDYLMALSLAVLVELPLAGLCLLAGYRAGTGGGPDQLPGCVSDAERRGASTTTAVSDERRAA